MLRPVQPDDAFPLYDLFSPEKGANFLDLPLGSRETFSRWLNEVAAGEFLGLCAARVIEAEDGAIAGMIILTSIDTDAGTAELGTWLGLPYRGKGLNKHAKQELLAFAFRELELKKVLVWISINNLLAKKALEKLPYVTIPDQEAYCSEKKHRKFLFRQPFTVYEILRSNYEKWQLN